MKRVISLGTLSAALTLAFAPLAPSHAAPAAQTASAAARQLKQLTDDYYLEESRDHPLFRTSFGDNRYDDQLGLAIGPKQRAQRIAALRKFAARLAAIKPAGLGHDDQVSYDVMDAELRTALAMSAFPDHLLPIDQMMFSTPAVMANLAGGESSQPFNTPAQYRAFLNRMRQLTPWLEQAMVNMREGIKAGIVQPAAITSVMVGQYQKMASATTQGNVFYRPIRKLPAAFSDDDKRALDAEYSKEINDRLNPVLHKLATFLEKDYLPASRKSSGWGALPQGKQWYRAHVESRLTTAMDPAEIHATGLKEVARIQQQFAELGPKMGYSGAPAGLPKWVAEQPQFSPFKSDQEILAVYRKLDASIGAKLPALFTLIPKAPLEHRLEPELTRATASDHYSPPAPDGSRPGIFWSVVNDPTKYTSTKMTTLLLHEGRPGHHFHLALQVEKSLPDFRRFGFNSAYAEGWALYAETLGKEMGLFEQPDQYFGHLNDELLRAVRLVVDTGLHDQGWTREQAIAYMRETLGYTDAVATNAVERYMVWPGQALAYKVGAMKISQLRQRAQAALGPKFSLPAFHAVVLADGTVPLAVLEKNVDRWIAASK